MDMEPVFDPDLLEEEPLPCVEVRVQNGIVALDNYFESESWRNRIDPSSLNMGSGDFCVLGQLFGSYHEGLDPIILGELDADEIEALGYSSPRDLGWEVTPMMRRLGFVLTGEEWRISYAELTMAWIRAIGTVEP